MEEEETPAHIDGALPYREGHLFIIDITPQMFKKDPETKQKYFTQCLEAYKRILAQKLSWNRVDYMGLVLFGTNTWDMNPETKHILTVQEFHQVKTDMLTEVIDILENQTKRYKGMSAEAACPLHDVLWQAGRSFESLNVTMFQRQVVLLTCRDNPLSDDEAECHRVRAGASILYNNKVNLKIVGLGQDWDFEVFYKDIEMLANNVQRDDIKRTFIDDLERQIKFRAKTTSHCELRVGNGLAIKVVISSFVSKTKYLKEGRINRETNEPLDYFPCNWYESKTDAWGEEVVDDAQMSDVHARYTNVCGGRPVVFTGAEMKQIRKAGPEGIDLIEFKEISLDLKYHVGGARFIRPDKMATEGEKQLFTALLCECEKKSVMGICAVNSRGGHVFAKLIPSTRLNGFYLYKIAYAEQVKDWKETLKKHSYGKEKKADNYEIDQLMGDLVDKLRMDWDPYAFPNPKLAIQLEYIQALALGRKVEPVEDATLPNTEELNEKLGDIAERFEEMCAMSAASAKRKPAATDKQPNKCLKVDETEIQRLIETQQLGSHTVEDLKAIARSIGAKTGGPKATLINSIIETFGARDLV